MKFLSALLLPSVILVGQAWASPVDSGTAALAATTASITYVGPHTPGGENVTLSGTAKAIYERILALNPAFNPDDFDITREASRAIKRTPISQMCNIPSPYNQPAGFEHIVQGISYLNNLPGTCGTNSGGVSRVSCSYDSAIYLVGKAPGVYEVACTYLDYMAGLVTGGDCVYNDEDGHEDVNGQECDSANYCVIVAGASC